jgi:beta-lactamase class A
MKLRIFIDGASRGNPGPAGLGVLVQDGRGRTVAEIAEFIGHATNNVAEYRALLRALEEAEARSAGEVELCTDSDLLVRQIHGTYKVKSASLAPLHAEAMQRLRRFPRWRVMHVPREENAAADALANRAIDDRLGKAQSRAGSVVSIDPRGPSGLREHLAGLARDLAGTLGVGVRSSWDGAEVYLEPDRPFPMASVFKIPVLIELLIQAEEGRLSLGETLRLTEELKAPGSGVLKELASAPFLSLADLAMLMIIISDNTATDILVDRVGLEAINRRLASWGFAVTRVPMTCRQLLYEIAGRPQGPFTPSTRLEVEQILRTRGRSFDGRAYADQDNNLTTPREMVALLQMLVGDGPLSLWVRERALEFLCRQQIRDRLPLHLPPGTEIAHKTGSIAGVRNDAGVIFVPRGPVLVCAFTRDLDDDLAGARTIAEVGRLVHATFT